MSMAKGTILKPRPLCECGCGHQVRYPRHRFLVGHVTREAKAEGGRMGRLKYVRQKQQERFERYRGLLPKWPTFQDLIGVFALVEHEAYQRGYHCADYKHRNTGQKRHTRAA